MTRYLRIRRTLIAATLFVGVAGAAGTIQANAATAAFPNVVVPAPVSETANGATFTLTSSATVSSDVPDVGAYLAGILRASTGYPVPVTSSSGTIALTLSGAPASVGTQGYQLTITGTNVTVQANQPAGLFAGVQTLLQLLPPAIESPTVTAGPWTAPGGTIVDYPRFAHRGAMLDVARHFFTVAQVERYLDEIALYKIDYFHLHLSDDQGWRLVINSWPNLATYGGSTEDGGGAGGHYTQGDYSGICKPGQGGCNTEIPKDDIPGPTNSAHCPYAAP